MGVLDEFNDGLAELRAANLPEYAKRLATLEVKVRDLEDRLRPLLHLLRTDV